MGIDFIYPWVYNLPTMKIVKDYIDSLPDDGKAAFASAMGTSLYYLRYQVGASRKKVGPEYALKLQDASKGVLQARALCPDFDWDAAARSGCPVCSQSNPEV